MIFVVMVIYSFFTRNGSKAPSNPVKLRPSPETARTKPMLAYGVPRTVDFSNVESNFLGAAEKVKNNISADPIRRRKEDCGQDACALYIMRAPKSTKIGISSDPDQRLRQLQTGNAEEVVLVAAYWFTSRLEAAKFEKNFHKRFENFHISGEWFQLKANSAKCVVEEILQSGNFPKPVTALTEAENEIANTRWRRSAKGNLYTKVRGKLAVVINKKGSFTFSIESEFSTKRYPTEGEAKYAAVAVLLAQTSLS